MFTHLFYLIILGIIFLLSVRKKKIPKVLVIEGNIGAGKSTLIEILASELSTQYPKIVTVLEPVELWKSSGALKDFYSDIEGKAYEFQTFAFSTRIIELREKWDKFPDADLYVIERSPYSDRYIFLEMLYQAGKLTDHQMMKFEYWWKVWIYLWPVKPTHVLHLNPGVPACQERTEKRQRVGEDAVDLNYQIGLQNQHRVFLERHCPHPHLSIDTTEDYRIDLDARRKLVDQVKTFLKINTSA